MSGGRKKKAEMGAVMREEGKGEAEEMCIHDRGKR